MLRRFCSTGWGTPSAAETAAIEQLLACNKQLLVDEGPRPEVESEAGYAACAAFLAALEAAALRLGLEVAPRAYRDGFSANYRALFPDGGRHYRVDILEASVDQHSAIWVNGDKFELSAEAIVNAEELQMAWAELRVLLERWSLVEAAARPAKLELATVLARLDRAWAGFEQKYISELIAIEERARMLIVQAVEEECRLQLLERQREGPESLFQAQRQLVASIGRLNSVANFRRKGRDDLGADILACSEALLRRSKHQHGASSSSAAEVLAADVVSSFQAMRSYLREVGRCLERVDPHLCNNAGLVGRLVDWEESWEVGARYVRQAPLMDALCDAVAEVRVVQQLAPALTSMCADCDVELFFVLPRLVMLCFVAEPDKERAELVRSLVPHLFTGEAGARGLGPELQELAAQLGRALRLLGGTPGPAAPPKGAAWETLVRRAVAGAGGKEAQGLGEPAQRALEDLMRELERWSLELQRRCPEDWNQCCAVLVQCIQGGSQRQPCTKFQV